MRKAEGEKWKVESEKREGGKAETCRKAESGNVETLGFQAIQRDNDQVEGDWHAGDHDEVRRTSIEKGKTCYGVFPSKAMVAHWQITRASHELLDIALRGQISKQGILFDEKGDPIAGCFQDTRYPRNRWEKRIVICPAGQIFQRRGGHKSQIYAPNGPPKRSTVGEFSDNLTDIVLPDIVLQAPESRPTQVEGAADFSTGFFGPDGDSSKLGDNTLAFSTCCQNRSEFIGGCLRINSIKALRSVVMNLILHRHQLPRKLNHGAQISWTGLQSPFWP